MLLNSLRILFVIIALSIASASQAAIMTATIVATGSGDLGGVGFSDAKFVIYIIYDTDDLFSSDSALLQVENQAASIAIPGFAPARIELDTRTFINDEFDVVGLGRGFGGLDLIDMRSPVFDGWDMTTPIGLVLDPIPFAIDQFIGVQTTRGELNFSSIVNANFSARIGGTIPEPGTLGLLLACGLPLLRRRNGA